LPVELTAIKVLLGLAFLQRNNMVHGMISRTSIFITKKGNVKIGKYCELLRIRPLLRSVAAHPDVWLQQPSKDGRQDCRDLGALVIKMMQPTSEQCYLENRDGWSGVALEFVDVIFQRTATELCQGRHQLPWVQGANIPSSIHLSSFIASSRSASANVYSAVSTLSRVSEVLHSGHRSIGVDEIEGTVATTIVN
jgi:hypothetical protein